MGCKGYYVTIIQVFYILKNILTFVNDIIIILLEVDPLGLVYRISSLYLKHIRRSSIYMLKKHTFNSKN